MGGTEKGTGGTVPETRRDRTTGTAQYLVVDEVVTLVGEMEKTAEAKVYKGEMATKPTPPPPPSGRTENDHSKYVHITNTQT